MDIAKINIDESVFEDRMMNKKQYKALSRWARTVSREINKSINMNVLQSMIIKGLCIREQYYEIPDYNSSGVFDLYYWLSK
jgi:hypothetical protein